MVPLPLPALDCAKSIGPSPARRRTSPARAGRVASGSDGGVEASFGTRLRSGKLAQFDRQL